MFDRYIKYDVDVRGLKLDIQLTPKMKGTIHEEECKLYFLKHGYTVSVPIGECEQYDFILDYENTLYKIQCKKPVCDGDTLTVESSKNISNTKCVRSMSYDKNKVDFFCCFYDNSCYLIPYTSNRLITLRLKHPKNNQIQNIRWAYEYEASYVLEKLNHPERCKPLEVLNTAKTSELSERKYFWITDGNKNKQLIAGHQLPEGFYFGRSGKCNQFT